MSKLPNFLIVGAAKSGTTSLASYISKHPDVYMSPVKEPHFLTSSILSDKYKGPMDDVDKKRIVWNYDDYIELFSDVRAETAIGEASTDLLYYYDTAITQIKNNLGRDVKIIIMLRNPIERAHSAYTHLRRDKREILSFSEAVEAESERIENGWMLLWHYVSLGFYYDQVVAYMNNFDDVKVYLFDDFKSDMSGVLADIFEFLSVDSSFVPDDFGVKYNETGIHRSEFVHRLFYTENFFKTLSKLFVPAEVRSRIRLQVSRRNLRKLPMNVDDREALKSIYKEDIANLSRCIKRDLSLWLK